MPKGTDGTFFPRDMFGNTQSISLEILSELGQATTAYHEALPDQAEYARQVYETALAKFNALQLPETD